MQPVLHPVRARVGEIDVAVGVADRQHAAVGAECDGGRVAGRQHPADR
jgi:hypothetical protein